jgi:hypothetical protein
MPRHRAILATTAIVGLGLASTLLLGQQVRFPAPLSSPTDSRLLGLKRAAAGWERRSGPERSVIDQVCLVPDEATFYNALATWDRAHHFPILIEDAELTLKFIRAFRPARVVRFSKTATPAIEGTNWERAAKAVLATRSGPKIDVPTPPGVVFGASDSPSLPGLAALAAGRFQAFVRLDPAGRFGDVLSPEGIDTLVGQVETVVKAVAPAYATLGDDCDFLTVAGDFPYRYSHPKGMMAVDDRLGRAGPDLDRWAFTGRLMGDARQSVYAAMCSLFLHPDSAMLFNGYPEDSPPWNGYVLRLAAETLRRVLPTSHMAGNPKGSLRGWHDAFDLTNRHGLLFINTKGGPNQFDLIGGPAHTFDVMPSVPTAVCIIHSYSAADPTDSGTIAGRWLAQGAFVYHGSMDEPYLNAFRPPEIVARLVGDGVPLGAALRAGIYETFGHPWKLVYLGDPLYRIVPTSDKPRRVPDFGPSTAWPIYKEGPRPDAEAGAGARLAWAVSTSIARQTSLVANDAIDDLLSVLRAIDRRTLSPPARKVLDELTCVLLVRARKVTDLRDAYRGIPEADRTPIVKRLAVAGLVATLSQALERDDFGRAGAAWSDLIRIDSDRVFKSQVTSRVAAIARSPLRLDEWKARLRATVGGKLDDEARGVVLDELKRIGGTEPRR